MIALDAAGLAQRELLGRRTVLLGAPVDSAVANAVVLQLLHLEAAEPGVPIRLLINSPGGEVYAGLAVHDVLREIASPVHTVCAGMAMSIASVIHSAGEPGERASYPNGRMLIHQPSGGFQGTSMDVAIQAREAIWLRDHLEDIYARDTGRTREELRRDMDRDRFFTPEEAREYGLIDRVLT
jgi:ATP-dependent Clp protease protease subunit